MLADALSRTILLAKTELRDDTPDDVVLNALTSTRVALVATDTCLRTHAGQSSYIATALLLARSGHSVWLSADDVLLVGSQPPLTGRNMISALREVGRDLLPGFDFGVGIPDEPVNLAVLFGLPEFAGSADQVVRVGWSKWAAALSSETAATCTSTDWPIGALAAAPLAASETFKAAMRKLSAHSRVPRWLFEQMFAPSSHAEIRFAPEDTPTKAELGHFDVISGGAITNSVLFGLLRLPDVRGACRLFDDDLNELSNLNRNALLRRSDLESPTPKVTTLAKYSGGLMIDAHRARYDEDFPSGPLASNVLVGVDDIPARWAVQRSWPTWLGVGATDAFSAYVSFHSADVPCVGCLHPEPLRMAGRIPTVAFVSFFAGLLLGSYLIRQVNDSFDPAKEQQAFMTVTRPESWSQGLVLGNARCPVGCKFAKAL